MPTARKPRSTAKKATGSATKALPVPPAPPTASGGDTDEDKAPRARRSSVVTAEVIAKVTKALEKADPAVGLSLKELETATGMTYRQVHNATWRMEGSPGPGGEAHPDERVIRRINTGRKVFYALRAKGDAANRVGKYATRGTSD